MCDGQDGLFDKDEGCFATREEGCVTREQVSIHTSVQPVCAAMCWQPPALPHKLWRPSTWRLATRAEVWWLCWSTICRCTLQEPWVLVQSGHVKGRWVGKVFGWSNWLHVVVQQIICIVCCFFIVGWLWIWALTAVEDHSVRFACRRTHMPGVWAPRHGTWA